VAKTSQVLRDNRRKKMIARYAARRAALRKILKDANASIDDKLEAQEKFAKLPRNSCPTRLNRRCEVSGRSHAYYRKFGISRIALRDLALKGQLPGVRKSSW
jgi:small subunit ribosomal protein S14